MTSVSDVRAVLAGIPDPCSIAMRAPVDICGLGLVEDVQIDDGRVDVTLVLTDPSCVHFNGLREFIIDEVSALPGVKEVSVSMSTTSLWTPDRATRRGIRA